MRKSVFSLMSITLFILLIFNFAQAQLIPPKAKGTPSAGPTINQAQKEDYMGPKARVAVMRFEDKSAKGSSEIGNGMAEMLGNALFSTNRYIVLERQNIDDVLYEQDLGASGRVRRETAAQVGEIEGADLLVMGTITEFEPGTAGAGGEKEIRFPLPGRISRAVGDVLGGVKAGGGFKKAHMALIVRVVDARTGRRLASEQVEGSATDIEGMGGLAGGVLSGVFSGYSKTPMEKAIRICIDEAVRLIVAKTPAEYYRTSAPPEPQAFPGPPPPAPPRPGTGSPMPGMAYPPTYSPMGPTPPPAGSPALGGVSRIVYVNWPQVSLRDGPGTNFRSTIQVQKGTPLAVLEESGHWYRVRLEDGQEGWIGKATTSDIP